MADKTTDKVSVKDLCAALTELIEWAADIREILCGAGDSAVIETASSTEEGGTVRWYGGCPPPTYTRTASSGTVRWYGGCPPPLTSDSSGETEERA